MRIGLVTGEYPPMEGGVGAFTRELALALADLNHEVFVFTRSIVRGSMDQGINLAAIAGKQWGWKTIGQIRSWAEHEKLDILNLQFQTAAYDMHPSIHWVPRALTQAGLPTVTTFHDLRAPYLFPKAGPLRAWSVRQLARWSSGVIATDHADEATLRDRWHVKHVRWIPIGSNVKPIAVDGAKRIEVRSRLGLRPEQLLISYFGFLNETKGALTLVDALDLLVQSGIDAHIVMIGGRAGASDPTNFDYGQRVDQQIEGLGLQNRVSWSGFVDDAAVSSYFYASDITALPYSDGASLRRGTLMAALAHGRAIVTTSPAAPELAGVVETVSPGNSSALARMLTTLWQDMNRRALLEQAAARASEQFSWHGIAQVTSSFYQELIGE